MTVHHDWVRQIGAELDGELTLLESAALARHLAECGTCSRARVSQLEMRLALARSGGDHHPRALSRPRLVGRTVLLWLIAILVAGTAGGWVAHARFGGPGPGARESSRAVLVVH